MKVMFISDELYAKSEVYNWSGYANRPIVDNMPCDTVICCSIDEVWEDISDTDVVLLESLRAVSFRDELTFLNRLPLFIAGFHCDVWRGPLWIEHAIRIDLSISVYKAVALKNTPAFRDESKFLWLPPRVDVFDFDVVRDIDLICWGALGREYHFRKFTRFVINTYVVKKTQKIDHWLSLFQLHLKGNDYILAILGGKRLNPDCYYGEKLFKLLYTSKLCPTGPVSQKGIKSVVARYFENAACGVVSITDEMEDQAELGFKHKENIWITDEDHFLDDLIYLLKHDDLVEEMSANAKQLIRERHTIDIRSQQLYQRLCEETGKE